MQKKNEMRTIIAVVVLLDILDTFIPYSGVISNTTPGIKNSMLKLYMLPIHTTAANIPVIAQYPIAMRLNIFDENKIIRAIHSKMYAAVKQVPTQPAADPFMISLILAAMLAA